MSARVTGRSSMRLPAFLLLAGCAVFVAGPAVTFVAPSLRDQPPFLTADVAAETAAIAGNPAAWRLVLGLTLAAAVITTIGLVPISLRFTGPALPWAVAALLVYAMGATLAVTCRLVGMGVLTWLAQQAPDPAALRLYEAFDNMLLLRAFVGLAFVSIGLYGAALCLGGAPRHGRAFVVVGLVGVLLTAVDAGLPLFAYLATAALGVVSRRLDFGELESR